ncbi:unnamed protein product [Nezara viridula]|uniref:Uncharacterized protein n=1 Tax=Nezara viridula TaxID=85310 RepID=A0A9P0MIG9_NEZVI|nr:unnamed protein product [Nezara viridula]
MTLRHHPSVSSNSNNIFTFGSGFRSPPMENISQSGQCSREPKEDYKTRPPSFDHCTIAVGLIDKIAGERETYERNARECFAS